MATAALVSASGIEELLRTVRVSCSLASLLTFSSQSSSCEIVKEPSGEAGLLLALAPKPTFEPVMPNDAKSVARPNFSYSESTASTAGLEIEEPIAVVEVGKKAATRER